MSRPIADTRKWKPNKADKEFIAAHKAAMAAGNELPEVDSAPAEPEPEVTPEEVEPEAEKEIELPAVKSLLGDDK